MDAVILAAGRGQRMEGLSKPFFKPLLELNGIPLLEYAIEYAKSALAERVIIVVSPANANDIAQVTRKYGEWISIVQQNEPIGPGHAALVGLCEVRSPKAMVLMSDNIMSTSVVAQMAEAVRTAGCSAIGIRHVHPDQASRFTRVRRTAIGYSFVEGQAVSAQDVWSDSKDSVVWCGPLFVDTAVAREVLSQALGAVEVRETELKIGPYLDMIMSNDTRLFDVEAFDVGIPSAYAEQQAGGAS